MNAACVRIIRLVVDGIEGHRSGNASIVREACAGAVRPGIPLHEVVIGLGRRVLKTYIFQNNSYISGKNIDTTYSLWYYKNTN